MTADPVALDERARLRPPVMSAAQVGAAQVGAAQVGAMPVGAMLAVAMLVGAMLVGAARAQEPAPTTPAAPASAPVDSAAASVVPAVPAAVDPTRDGVADDEDGAAGGGAAESGLTRSGAAGAAEAAPPVNLWSTGVNATGAVLMTPLFPGWGQLYADGGWRAALAFGTEMYFWSSLLSRDRQARRDLDFAATLPEGDASRSFAESLAVEHKEQRRDFVWWSGGALLIIALDAYVGAHLFNFDQDAVPVPDRWEDVFGPVGSGPAAPTGPGPEVTVFQWRKGF